VLAEDAQQAVYDAVMRLDRMDRIGELMQLFA
jgi:hypothetical protein